MTNIRNYDPEDGSYGKHVSRYVGDLNYRKIPNTITWRIVCRAPTSFSLMHSRALKICDKGSQGAVLTNYIFDHVMLFILKELEGNKVLVA